MSNNEEEDTKEMKGKGSKMRDKKNEKLTTSLLSEDAIMAIKAKFTNLPLRIIKRRIRAKRK